MEEHVILLDEHGQPCGTQEKMKAHYLGQFHLAFSVLLYRKGAHEREYLLQRREISKYHSGGLWTNTCCSHPRLGESLSAAGVRRLKEEMGIDLTQPLEIADKFIYRAQLENDLIEHELDHILIACVEDLVVTPNWEEVMAWQWWSESELMAQLKTAPDSFTVWFNEVFQRTYRYLEV